MSQMQGFSDLHIARTSTPLTESQSPLIPSGDLQRSHPSRCEIQLDPLLTVEEVTLRLKVSKDWVWDHSSRKSPHLPVIRLGDGALRFRASSIEEFICERERLSNLRRGSR
jgi:predicted DNA-binding transcriptional regulator AlpA